MRENDRIFYSSLIITLLVLFLIIYISSTQPSKEEFVQVYWQDYPKNVSQQDFTVGFVIKSYYARTLDFDVTLSVDSDQTETKIVTLKPNEEIISRFNVTLPTEGLHNVKITTTPTTIEKENEIEFWVERI